MKFKRIEMDWSAGTDYSLFTQAVDTAKTLSCDDVVFEFNGGKFSVDRKSTWSDSVSEELLSYPRKDYEVKL